MKKLMTVGIVPLFLLCILTSACSSRSKETKAVKAIRTAMVDQQVNDVEFASSLALVKKAGIVTMNDAGVQTPIRTDEDLALYLIGKGITGPATRIGDFIKKTVPLKAMKVLLENSSSMQGYFKSGTSAFTRPVISLYNGVPKDVIISTAYIGENAQHKAVATWVDKNKFDSDLANGRVMVGQSSPLDQIFVEAIGMASDSEPTISCVVTDGIISGTNQEIARDRDFTKKNLPLIEQRIRDAVSSQENVDFLVYRFDADFKGTYFDYQNGRHNLSDATRPFFVFLFGNADHLTEFAKKVEAEPYFKFTDRLASYEAGGYQTLTKGQLLPSQNAVKVNIVPAQNSVIIPAKQLVAPVNFRLKFSVRDLPAFVNDEQFLQSNLAFQYKDPSTGILLPAVGFLQGVHVDNPTLGTYLLDLQVSPDLAAKFGNSMDIQVFLGGILDDWYIRKTSSNDTVSGGDDQNTFCLEALIGAMLMGKDIQPNNLKEAIDIPVKIVKK